VGFKMGLLDTQLNGFHWVLVFWLKLGFQKKPNLMRFAAFTGFKLLK